MPIYDFRCAKCGFAWADLRLEYDTAPPTCTECKKPMERVFGVFTFTMK